MRSPLILCALLGYLTLSSQAAAADATTSPPATTELVASVDVTTIATVKDPEKSGRGNVGPTVRAGVRLSRRLELTVHSGLLFGVAKSATVQFEGVCACGVSSACRQTMPYSFKRR